MTRVLCLLLLLTGCAHHPPRVNCKGHLEAINVPVTSPQVWMAPLAVVP